MIYRSGVQARDLVKQILLFARKDTATKRVVGRAIKPCKAMPRATTKAIRAQSKTNYRNSETANGRAKKPGHLFFGISSCSHSARRPRQPDQEPQRQHDYRTQQKILPEPAYCIETHIPDVQDQPAH